MPPRSVVFHCNLCVSVCNDMLVVLKCVVFRCFGQCYSVSVFSPPSSSPLIIIVSIIVVLFSPLNSQFSVMGALDGCFGWGLVLLAGLVAGLQVGQAFGVFLLPELGVGGSSPKVPRHPTSMCDSGINLPITCEIFHHLLLVFSTQTAKPSLCFFAWFLCILFQFGGVSDRMVNTLNSRSGGPGFNSRVSNGFLRQGTLHHFARGWPCDGLASHLGGNGELQDSYSHASC